jgi:hypothetical protein
VSDRVLTAWELNRALLARQLLLERSSLSIPRLLELREEAAGLIRFVEPDASSYSLVRGQLTDPG